MWLQRIFTNPVQLVVALVLLIAPGISCGEKLNIQLQMNPKLVERLNSPEPPPMYSEGDSPAYNLTRFVVEGETAEDWIEAVEIISIAIQFLPKDVQAWYDDFRAKGEATCQDEWNILNQDQRSMLFERISPPCNDHVAQHALYRVIYGDLNVFVVIATRKGEMNAETHEAWLAVLGSAEVQ